MVKRIKTSKAPVQITGLPNNNDVLQYMIKYRPAPEASPNRRYSYCNTNYAMLALIVERITQMPFPVYMQEHVFKPLGMTSTYVFSVKDTAKYIPSYNYNNSNESRGFKNYGLGWHLLIKPPDPTIVYHNGWWHGNNAVFKRLIADSATVIILGNKFNKNIWAAGKMSSVFTGHADTTRLDE
jgi:CubicO group peptidase (beta-lactamase class C family)